MLRFVFLLAALASIPIRAEDESGPVISINSPDTGTTFVLGTIKNRALIWDDKTQTLWAEVTFIDEQQSTNQPNDDTHRFRLPGVALDKAHGIFYATTPKGETIAIARRKKVLFISTIEILPNAMVRIFHPHGDISVRLEAIRPVDVAKVRKAQDDQDNPDHTHSLNIQDILH